MAIFDKEATFYDNWYKTKLGEFVDKVETECAFSLLSLSEGSKIIDVGCGTGNFSIKLAKKHYDVVGIDISKTMLDIARKKVECQSLDIEFINMDAYHLEFEDESFDGAISMASFEFFKKPEKIIEEIFRIIKRGSPVVVGIINRESEWGKLYTSNKYKENSIFKYAKLKTLEEMKNIKSQHLVKVQECLFIPPGIDLNSIDHPSERKLEKRGGFICLLWIK